MNNNNNTTPDLCQMNLAANLSISDHFCQNLKIPSPSDKPLEHFHDISNNQSYFNVPNTLHVPHDQNIGYSFGTESSFNVVKLEGNLVTPTGQIIKDKRLQLRKKSKPLKKTSIIKGQRSSVKDRLLMQLVEAHGTKTWSEITKIFNERIEKQCRERLDNHLSPDIKKESWSEKEDRIRKEIAIGNKWAEICKKLLRRSENAIKNHSKITKDENALTIGNRRGKGKNIAVSDYSECNNLIDGLMNLELADGKDIESVVSETCTSASGSGVAKPIADMDVMRLS